MLNPVHLRTLIAVLRTGSFADAGRRLGYTGSAVSQQIYALERSLRVDLFERDAHSIRPTPAAEFIADHATTALGNLQALEDDITGMLEGSVGRLRLGSFPSASERLLPAALSAFVRQHPSVAVRLDEGEPRELVPLLESRELDLALVYRYDRVPQSWPPGVCATNLLTEDLLLLLPKGHPRAGDGPVALADLADQTWISTREGTSMASNLRRLCASAGFEPSVSFASNDYDVILGLVGAGLGIAVIPALGYVESEDVVSTPVAGGATGFRHVLALTSPVATLATTGAVIAALMRAAVRLADSLPGVSLPSV